MSEKRIYECPCCGQITLPLKDFYCICPVCGWEDDPGQHRHPDDDKGANTMSLNQAKGMYKKGIPLWEGFMPAIEEDR